MLIASAVAGRVAGQAALAGGELGEVEAPPAELGGHGGGEVADRAQLGEVLVEVGVGLVERRRPGSGSAPASRSGSSVPTSVGSVSWSWSSVVMARDHASIRSHGAPVRSHGVGARESAVRARAT